VTMVPDSVRTVDLMNMKTPAARGGARPAMFGGGGGAAAAAPVPAPAPAPPPPAPQPPLAAGGGAGGGKVSVAGRLGPMPTHARVPSKKKLNAMDGLGPGGGGGGGGGGFMDLSDLLADAELQSDKVIKRRNITAKDI
jgi:hypothetical protein